MAMNGVDPEWLAESQRLEAASPVNREGVHGWIQWKGTHVCIDLHCACGAEGHLDTDFMYAVKCAACGALYAVDPHVTLLPMQADHYGAESTHTFEALADEVI